jgi:hypothetical protein
VIAIVRFFVGLMALDPRGQSAVDATFADWRHELTSASTADRRLLINVRSVIGVARTIAKAGSAELRSTSVLPFVLKLGAMVVLWVVWMLKDGPPGDTYRFFLATSQAKASTLVGARLFPQLLILFPLMVFLSESLGRRRRVTPVVGTSVLLTAVVLLFGLVLLPAALTYSQYETWRYFANASVAEPDVTRRLLSGFTVLTTIATAVSLVAVWLLFVFANRVRRVGGVTGWGIGLGVLFMAYITGIAIPFVRFPILWILPRLSWPFLIVAALVWATNYLARIDAARSANNDRLPINGVSL